MISVGVIGATGYTGEELVYLLSRHPQVTIRFLSAIVEKEESIAKIVPRLSGLCDCICKKPGSFTEAVTSVDLIYLALPHRVSMEVAPTFLNAGKKVIDLSADYRLSPETYAAWYGVAHKDTEHLGQAVYGLPELFADRIQRASLIANPGCYPTGAILALAPLLKGGLIDQAGIIIDSKSGMTGAGRKADIRLIFSEVNENLRAYRLHQHQHQPEIEKILSEVAGKAIEVVFTPHIVPINRGILSTIYARLTRETATAGILSAYAEFYRNKPFVKVMDEGKLPEIKDVAMTNRCHIGAQAKKKTLICVSCIDNLLKGAAGQAVQNMNLMFGFRETEGLL